MLGIARSVRDAVSSTIDERYRFGDGLSIFIFSEDRCRRGDVIVGSNGVIYVRKVHRSKAAVPLVPCLICAALKQIRFLHLRADVFLIASDDQIGILLRKELPILGPLTREFDPFDLIRGTVPGNMPLQVFILCAPALTGFERGGCALAMLNLDETGETLPYDRKLRSVGLAFWIRQLVVELDGRRVQKEFSEGLDVVDETEVSDDHRLHQTRVRHIFR